MDSEKKFKEKPANTARRKERRSAHKPVGDAIATGDVCTTQTIEGTMSAATVLHKKSRRIKALKGRVQPVNPDAIDYVLYFEPPKSNNQKDLQLDTIRRNFEKQLMDSGFQVDRVQDEDCCYVLLRCSFETLAKEAERIRLEMPLDGQKLKPSQNNLTDTIDRCFKTDFEEDYASAPFQLSQVGKFLYGNDEEKFFRPALRSLLVHSILSNINLEKVWRNDRDMIGGIKVKSKGLARLIMDEVYKDAFILHESSDRPTRFREKLHMDKEERTAPVIGTVDRNTTTSPSERGSARDALDRLWPFPFKYQPMWMIRNYFGEEIALYFAWVGLLTWSIFIPALFGLAIFAYGIWLSVMNQATNSNVVASNVTTSITSPTMTISTTGVSSVTFSGSSSTIGTTAVVSNTTSLIGLVVGYGEDLLFTIKDALDNDLTPWYSIVICVWGTIFLELWKRRNAQLAFEWDVDGYEENEVDRPEYKGNPKEDKVTQEQYLHYSAYIRAAKIMTSFSFLIIMVCIVIMTTVAVVVYRVFINVDYCISQKWSSLTCTVMTSLVATTANAIVILLLGLLYEKLAYLLTDWENHQTTTEYKDALIIKLFAFLFTNNFASLFYIAFFRGNVTITGSDGIMGLGANYVDRCSQGSANTSCMSMLSLQILILIIIKPIISTAKELVAPIISKLRSKLRKVGPANALQAPQDEEANKQDKLAFLNKERMRPPLGDFTLSQYADKIIQYGYLMIFAVAMPLAPFIVLLVNLVDRVMDSRRMLWKYRRPVALRAQDIGTWYYTLDFLNVCGVITNACLVAFTSKWGSENLIGSCEKLAFILAYEHGVFALKYFIAVLVPDVSRETKKAMRREKYLVNKVMQLQGDSSTKQAGEPSEKSPSRGRAGNGASAPHALVAKKSKSTLPELTRLPKTLAESSLPDAVPRDIPSPSYLDDYLYRKQPVIIYEAGGVTFIGNDRYKE